MMIRAQNVLNDDELTRLRGLLTAADWADGRITAGTQSAQVKQNRQLPETAAEISEARAIVRKALARHALFFSATLPHDLYPPLFNRYGVGEHFGNHIDNSVRLLPDGSRNMRTDISATLFLNEPDEYDGGELVIEDHFGDKRIKLAAGDMIIYPGTTLHRVEPVTRGERLACFTWVQSMVRDANQRSVLFDMDIAIATLRKEHGDNEALIRLTGSYHNLLRMWTEL